MKRLIYLPAVLLVVLLAGCKDEEPVTAQKPKLDYYIESLDITDLGFQPQLKVTYAYAASGKLSQYTVYSYNPASQSFVEQRYFDFYFIDDRVDRIEGYLADVTTPYIAYKYQYQADARVSKIIETNHGAGINSEATFHYDPANESLRVDYSFSNGGQFQYEVRYTGENIISDKTTRGSQLCSDGEYTYDLHTNPFRNLGYVDYFLNNLSANNKLTEDVNYVGCAFPSLVPESYSYEYDSRGYPTSITTLYKGGTAKARKEIFYN